MSIQKLNGISENKDSIQLNKVVTNPFINSIYTGNLSKNKETNSMTTKEYLHQQAALLPNDIRQKFLESLEKGTTEKDFIDLLNERYEKRQAEFEVAWAEYQEAKNNLKLLEKLYNAIEKQYANSESDFELGKITIAEKNKNKFIIIDGGSSIIITELYAFSLSSAEEIVTYIIICGTIKAKKFRIKKMIADTRFSLILYFKYGRK